jgi:hypothetical protein
MPNSRQSKRLTLGTSATYRISVQGRLGSSLINRLGSMCIYTCTGEDQAPVTTLVGRIRDQAELVGVLNSLYELHLPLLSVELLNDE